MRIELFYRKIVEAVGRHSLDKTSELNLTIFTFLKFLDAVFKDEDVEPILKMTRMSILFEGFFRSLAKNSALNKDLNNVSLARWDNHYGTPTITFLLTYNAQIELTKVLFGLKPSAIELPQKPWEIPPQINFSVDKQNDIIVDERSTDGVVMPSEDEKTGRFLKTHNPFGGFTTTPCDPVSQKFIKYASTGRTVLEIGAAFGAASLEALAKGATVFCNDIEPNNLAVVRNRYLKKSNDQQHSVTGDDSKLILVPGAFPEELSGLAKNFFDAILICRVLHFFTGDKIEKALQQLSSHLKPGGKLFVVCETPFLKNWQRFIPEHEKRVKAGVKWPGEITKPADFESSGRAASLPTFVHWITKEILDRSLAQSKFGVEYLSYIDRRGQFPDDLLLDGKESIGAVVAKGY